MGQSNTSGHTPGAMGPAIVVALITGTLIAGALSYTIKRMISPMLRLLGMPVNKSQWRPVSSLLNRVEKLLDQTCFAYNTRSKKASLARRSCARW